MANHSLPTNSSLYTAYTTEVNARIDDAVKWNSSSLTTATNLPTDSVRWNTTNLYWERWTGSAWTPLSAAYTISINGGSVGLTTQSTGSFTTLAASSTVSGTGFSTYLASPPAIGGTAACSAGTFTVLTVNTTCTLPAAATVTGNGTVVGTTATQTLTNKTLTSPVIGTIVNTGTLTLPTTTTTLVGTSTTDTLTNKTLTAPRFASSGFIADANGNEQIGFVTTASAVTYLNITNGATGVAPSITAAGETNTSLNLKSTGTGTVQANGVQLVDLTSTQTMSGKTITGTFTGNLTGNVTGNVSGSSGSCTGAAASATTAATAAGLSITLPIANGGTNSTAAATAGGAGYGTGTAHGYTAAGTAGQVLTSNGSSAPTWGGISGTNLTNGTITAAKLDGAQSGTAPIYGTRAWVNFDGTTAGTFAGGTTTLSRTAGSGTCSCTTTNPHGLITGNVVYISNGTFGSLNPSSYVVTVTGTTTFQVTSGFTTALSLTITITTRTIRAAGNVSSISYVSAGNYYINFAVAMPDANYALLATVGMGRNPASTGNGADNDDLPFIGECTPQYARLYIEAQDDGVGDKSFVSVAFIR